MGIFGWFKKAAEVVADPGQVPYQLDVATQFSRFPAGRTKADGDSSGEHLREIIVSILRERPLTICLDGTQGYGSSFLQGAFLGLSFELSTRRLTLVSKEDPTLVTEAWSYINSRG